MLQENDIFRFNRVRYSLTMEIRSSV